MRASGEPVSEHAHTGYVKASNEAYDKVAAKLKVSNTRIMDADVSRRMTRLLQRIEKSIRRRYPAHIEVPLPTTAADWQALVKQYGPIAVAREQDTGNIGLIIMDMGV